MLVWVPGVNDERLEEWGTTLRANPGRNQEEEEQAAEEAMKYSAPYVLNELRVEI